MLVLSASANARRKQIGLLGKARAFLFTTWSLLVRVMLKRHLPVLLLDLLHGGCLTHLKQLVQVFPLGLHLDLPELSRL